MENLTQTSIQSLAGALREAGFAFVEGPQTRAQLQAWNDLSDWDAFAASWNDLPLDTYMADQGRYRRRRHASFHLASDGAVRRLPHRPHFQALDYNPLNGGIQRWFEPIADANAEGETVRAVFSQCHAVVCTVEPAPAHGWLVEVHQFRIEALPGEPGLPTPEGMHRDGVDHVLVLMVQRCNIRSGTTLIGTADGSVAGSFTLARPFDAAWVEDRRMHHGVTAVEAVDPDLPAWRDVLVVTLRSLEPGEAATLAEPGA